MVFRDLLKFPKEGNRSLVRGFINIVGLGVQIFPVFHRHLYLAALDSGLG